MGGNCAEQSLNHAAGAVVAVSAVTPEEDRNEGPDATNAEGSPGPSVREESRSARGDRDVVGAVVAVSAVSRLHGLIDLTGDD